jgi:two-component system, OmpR family, phosphate regulon sensor histidine kinase PhoR
MSYKNPTPQELAFYSALIIAGVNALLLFFLKIIFRDISWLILIIAILVVFAVGYYVFLYALERFIYRKIKLVYKAIHHLKRAKGELPANLDMRNHIIDEVEAEVMNWAKSQKIEMDNLKEMEAYRRNFMGNISHELKTPIFNIQGYLYTVLDGDIEDEEMVTRYLNKAANNLERLNTIIQDLEQISQLEAGKLSMEFHPFDIYTLTKEVYEDLEMSAAEKNIVLSFKEGSRRPFIVNADREAIRQVLTNLIVNSIKYGKQNGTTLASFYKMNNEILIEISDNGIGISEVHLLHLFERFYRVDKGRSRNQGGTGLGLSIVKHIIEAHDQTVNVRSLPNVGSTFGFTLEMA